ncbi:response regulator transcription factor [Streptomyces niger]|uniref:response regulator transcription factor n=1 Tax=Streptomyces niger TaxID=66373 RepID=UPI00069BF689|nr:response regulator transcription factor [Streptomyces niger]
MIRILIVDGESSTRSGLRAALGAAEGVEVVGEGADGSEAVDAATKHQPDVVLLDLRVKATLQLLKLASPPQVLLLTRPDSDGSLLEALDGGAMGFLPADSAVGDLVAAVRVVAAGGTVLAPAVLSELAGKGRAVPPGGQAKVNSLSQSEREVLALIGAGRTNQQIAEELHLSVTSVRTYVSRVLARLGLDHRTQAALLAYELGMVAA